MRRDIQPHRDLPDTPISRQQQPGVLGNTGLQAILIVLVALGAIGFFISQNQQSSSNAQLPVVILPTQTTIPEWKLAVENQVQSYVTDTPTPIVLPTNTPTPRQFQTANPFDVSLIEGTILPTFTPGPTSLSTEVFRGSTPVPSPTGVVASVGTPDDLQPPPESLPLSLQPYDHFFMRRPINATSNGEALFYYPYGSDGNQGFRIHHGIDIPNPVGEQILAAADGVVEYAGSTDENTRRGTMEIYVSYGQMVVIRHNFSYQGQPVWTLYAHMSEIYVQEGDIVKMGDVIGEVGETGYVTGAHVHFEVRIGINSYYNTRNPLLWIAPYLNRGVVAGSVVTPDGEYIQNALVQLNRSGRRVDSTTTYISPKQPGASYVAQVVPDDNWQENFVMSDVPAGVYRLVVVSGDQRFTQEIEVLPGLVNFYNFQIDTDPTGDINEIVDDIEDVAQ